MIKPERSVYTAQDFLHWRAANSLELTPKFQRRGVWSSFDIESPTDKTTRRQNLIKRRCFFRAEDTVELDLEGFCEIGTRLQIRNNVGSKSFRSS